MCKNSRTYAEEFLGVKRQQRKCTDYQKDKVTRRFSNGGLAVGRKEKNLPLLGKWMWRLSLEEDSLWAKDIRSIHGLRPNGWDTKVEEQNVPKKSKEMYEQSLLLIPRRHKYRGGNQ